MEDHLAIARTLSGDTRAFGVLIGRYQNMVQTVTGRVMRNRMDAEEVTQDVFVKAHQKLREFQGQGKFSTWLYSIAYRTAISALRSKKDAGRSLDELQAHGSEPMEDAIEPINERRVQLEIALGKLDQEDAALLTMFYLEEMSVEEIVTVTQLSASNVKVRLHRNRKKLLALLHDQLKNELWTMSARA